MFTLSWLYNFVARAIVVIHSGLRHVVGENGWAWALSIIVLVAAVRLVLIPIFVKQIKTQRTMQVMQPKVKELREKYKNDKQKLNEEMIKLQKEHGNPLLGCLPTVLQIPLFLSLYRVMNGFSPKSVSDLTTAQKTIAQGFDGYYPTHLNGLSVAQADQIAHAKIFGASLATSLLSKKATLDLLGGNAATTKIVAIVLIIVMAVTTYVTQRQIIGRNGPAADPSQAMTQKLLLYASPLALAVFGIRISIGGLLYWFTTNFWSMGQQFIVIRRMPPVVGVGAAGGSAAGPPAKPPGGSSPPKLGRGARRTPPPVEPPVAPRMIQQRVPETGSGSRPPVKAQRGGSASRRRKSRRGGRH